MKDSDVIELLEEWIKAIQTGDSNQVLSLYKTDAILLPTVSNQVRHNHEEIKDYFMHFLAKGPQCKIDESNVRIFGDVSINSGVYSFQFNDGSTVQARFTYVYHWNGKRWMIESHHSSAMPE